MSFKTVNILLKKIFFIDITFIDNPQKALFSLLSCYNDRIEQVRKYIYFISFLKMSLLFLKILCHRHNSHRQSTKSNVLYAMLP